MGCGAEGRDTLPEVALEQRLEWRPRQTRRPQEARFRQRQQQERRPRGGNAPGMWAEPQGAGGGAAPRNYPFNECLKDQINDPSVRLWAVLGEDRKI